MWFYFSWNFGLYLEIDLNETFCEIQIGRHFSHTFPKGLKEGVIALSSLCFSSVLLWNMSLTWRGGAGDISTPQEFIFQQFAYFLEL